MAKKRKSYENPAQAALAGDLEAFLRLGGVRAIEREAVHATLQSVRHFWMHLLEEWRADYAEVDGAYQALAYFDTEIKTLRQQIGIKQTIEERRAKTLARVRKHRAAKKARVA